MSIRAIFAHLFGFAVLLAAMLVLPQAALAHAGHTHAMHAHAKAAPAVADVSSASVQQVEQSLTEAGAKHVHHHDDGTPCSGDGCCTGSCAACFGIVAPATPVVIAPLPRRAIALPSDRNHADIDGPSLLRPPRSLA